MTQAIATQAQQAPDVQLMEAVLVGGDLSKMSASQRLAYYKSVCESLGLNPLTQPFSYISYNGKLILYAGRNCTDQLRSTRRINLSIVAREKVEDVYVVTARATMPDGRTDESIGAIYIGGLKGESLANALMKTETKAKRRATLSVCGLSWADESEVGSIPNAQTVNVDVNTGEILEAPQAILPMPAGPLARRTVTAAQGQQVAGLVHELGWAPADVTAALGNLYNARKLAELTSAQVMDFMDYLQVQLARKGQDFNTDIIEGEQEAMEL
jgi:hypothetical protein